MDSGRFDTFARAIGAGIARRSFLSSVATGVLGLRLADAASAAVAPDLSASEVRGAGVAAPGSASAEKKRKKRKKKKKGKDGGNPRPTPQNPPTCTTASCPLSSECSQQPLDACTTRVFNSLQSAVSGCATACEDPDGGQCQRCLDPIVAEGLPEALGCIERGCPGTFISSQLPAWSPARSRDVAAEAVWARTCDKACCYTEMQSCLEDMRDEFFICMAAAALATLTAPPAGAAGLAACMAKGAFDIKKCEGRFGCPLGSTCLTNNTCCVGGGGCGDFCCREGTICTRGSHNGVPRFDCCNPQDHQHEMLVPCDGVCCAGPENVQCCAPGAANPCRC